MKKIIIIEDEMILADALKEKLTSTGYETEVAYDGESGLKKIEQGEPDLLILDILLPGVDGYQVLEKLKKVKVSFPILIVSNSGQMVDIEKAKELGAADFIVKATLSLKDIEDKVKKLIG